MIVLSASDVANLLPMQDAIEIVQTAMIGVARGEGTLPLRHAIDVGGGNKLGIMPGVLSDGEVYGVKLLSLFPGNPAKGLSSHIGAMVLFDPDTGEASAMMSADALTAIRTAAASAAATRALARKDASVLAIIGTGEQADSHIQAISAVRDIREVRIAGRDLAKAQAFSDKMSDLRGDITFKPMPDAQAAVGGADIVCTVTSSAKPVLHAHWLAAGTHINAVGASMPMHQEIDQSVLLGSEIFVDYRPSAFAQAREIIDALASGKLTENDILAEIGAVYCGDHPGRSSSDAITLYRSLGVASQDLACAEFVRRKAIETGLGVEAKVS
jgi:ornithine cyclodeaminase/alanine dehydrogenase-like protein (mu-crystallin family)